MDVLIDMMLRQVVQIDESERSAANESYAPVFGHAKSEYIDVKLFYGYWIAFSSCRSFAWCDEYKPTDNENRFVRRAIDKENKKLREIAKKAYNSQVLQIDHVRLYVCLYCIYMYRVFGYFTLNI